MRFKFQISKLMLRMKRLASAAWWYLRQVSGDAAYENYLRHAAAPPAGAEPSVCPACAHGPSSAEARGGPCRTMRRDEFYLDALRRRYSGVSRCC
jgi:uncharacterized short protein YbdD (DUF466 family)